MISEPRVWKWLVPAIVMLAMVPLGAWVNMISERNTWLWLGWCNFLVIGMMPILGIQAWAAFGAYYRHLDVQDYIDKRNAVTTTPETRLFEFARTMHPEAVKLLLMQRKTKWRVTEAKLGDLVDWVLDADPRVRVEFVEYLLEHSSQYAMYPANSFNEGACHFDPDKVITDREQYQAFHRILINRLIATEAFGNQPGQWIEPWNPALVARQFGIALGGGEAVDVPVAVRAPVVSEVGKVAEVAEVSKVVEVSEVSKVSKVVEAELSDADMQRIARLERDRAQMTVKEYMSAHNVKKIN